MKTKKAATKRIQKERRPLHKRVLLHPFSIMVLLCAGVIIAATTFKGQAATYDVTATVTAELPGAPAVIAYPYGNQHFSEKPIGVTGSCPDGSYVKLYRNSAFSGAAQCAGGNFSIQTDLFVGANILQTKVYNVNNQEGPQSDLLTVYYDLTTLAPVKLPGTPTQLQIVNLDQAKYSTGLIRNVSTTPTISGFAPPFSDIEVTIHSDPVVCKTRANSAGWWACTFAQPLPAGLHSVEVVATTADGSRLILPAFTVSVQPGVANLKKTIASAPLLINSEYQYQTHYPDELFEWPLSISGGQPPYTVAAEWGDGSTAESKQTDSAGFVLSHAYKNPKVYTVIVKTVDANGTTAYLQLSAVVKDHASAASVSEKKQGPVTTFSTELRRYLWLIWPAYVAVAFMIFCYWLGEREMYRHFMLARINSQQQRPVRARKRRR